MKIEFLKSIEYIVIHHSFTDDQINLINFHAIKKYHIETRGYIDIGYHFVIENIPPVILVGRPLDMAGAHTLGLNNKSIGICFVGNFDVSKPKKETLLYAIHYLIAPLIHIFNIPVQNVIGHREVNKLIEAKKLDEKFKVEKTCPGKNFDMDEFRALILKNVKQ